MLHRILVIHPPEPGCPVQLVGVRLVWASDPHEAVTQVRQVEPVSRTVAYDMAYAPGTIVDLPHMTMSRAEAWQWVREAAEVA